MSSLLQNVDVETLGLVHRGANKRRFAFKKGSTTMDINELIAAVLKEAELTEDAKTALTEAVKAAELNDKAEGVIDAIARLLKGFETELPANVLETVAKVAGLELPVVEKTVEVVKEIEVEKAAEEETLPQDIDPAAKAAIEKSQADAKAAMLKAEQLEEMLNAERDRALEKASIEKAGNDFPLLGSAEKIGKLIKSVTDNVSAEVSSELESVLKAAQAKLHTSSLLKEEGENDPEAGSNAMSVITAKANALVEKGEARNYADGVSIVLQNDPALYESYRAEKES